jgi:hypothetical protein
MERLSPGLEANGFWRRWRTREIELPKIERKEAYKELRGRM